MQVSVFFSCFKWRNSHFKVTQWIYNNQKGNSIAWKRNGLFFFSWILGVPKELMLFNSDWVCHVQHLEKEVRCLLMYFLQLSQSPLEKRPSYDAIQGANVNATTFYNIGDLEVQDNVARIWYRFQLKWKLVSFLFSSDTEFVHTTNLFRILKMDILWFLRASWIW